MTGMAKPLVLLDPHPRTRDMIFAPADWRRLRALVDVVAGESGPLGDTLVDECLPRVCAVIGQTPLPTERLQRATALRAIFNVEGNFLPNVDYAYCFRQGIRVAVAAPAFAAPVAEYALALTLDLLRGVTRADRAFRNGRETYGWRGNVEAASLFGADVGVVGFGNIGRALVPLLAPFRCRIRVHDPWLPDAVIVEHGTIPASLADVLERSRVVVVLAAATRDNRHFIGAGELARMRPGSKLVLLSRADVVDFAALQDATASGRIEAAVDVFSEEPVAPNDPLRGAAGILLSAHRAGGLDSALKAIGAMVVDDLDLVLRGLPAVRLQCAQPETVGLLRSSPGIAGAAPPRDHASPDAEPEIH
jgi:phosphoglycerate dehydrogenase-like enzyme